MLEMETNKIKQYFLYIKSFHCLILHKFLYILHLITLNFRRNKNKIIK